MRECLLQPIPEMELAAKLLDSAADALMMGDKALAARLLRESDFKRITQYMIKLVGPLSEHIHKQTKLPEVLPKADRHETRMPPASIQRKIFSRDGWRCRFCGIRVISREGRKTFLDLFPNECHWSAIEYDRHSALYAMAVSLDHLVPHSRGGTNVEDILVTTCFCCQFGRGQYTIEEVELSDPRSRPPEVDDWDGLERLGGFTADAI